MITEDAILNLFPHGYRELVSVLPSLPRSQFKFRFWFRFRLRFRIPAFPYARKNTIAMHCGKTFTPPLLFHLELPELRISSAIDTYASLITPAIRGTQREYSLKPLKHSIVKRILVFKR